MQRELRQQAKRLRKNMSDTERMLWKSLRRKNLGVKFRRQEPLDLLLWILYVLRKNKL
jgi:very-short-patch-repair endonuclease